LQVFDFSEAKFAILMVFESFLMTSGFANRKKCFLYPPSMFTPILHTCKENSHRCKTVGTYEAHLRFFPRFITFYATIVHAQKLAWNLYYYLRQRDGAVAEDGSGSQGATAK
jgi:hypothetical protein